MTRAPVLYDFETRSRVDLKSVGGRRYWWHPSTEAICCSWHDLETGETGTWIPGEEWPHYGRVLAAHNASHFDRFGLVRVFGHAPRRALAFDLDTANLARKAGFPGSLDALGGRIGYAKDRDGSRFTRALSTIRRPTKKTPAPGGLYFTPEEWRTLDDHDRALYGVQTEITPEARARVIAYCERDVGVLREAWPILEPWIDVDRDAEELDRTINDRGVPFDRELARALLGANDRRCEAVVTAAARELGWTPEDVRRVARSPQAFCEATGADNMQADTVLAMAAQPDAHPLVRVRQSLGTIAGGKLEAGLARVCLDDRLRDAHQYGGAHTLRWSGRGMQLQNLPKPDKTYEDWTDEWIDELACAVAGGAYEPCAAEIDLLVRATLCAEPDHVLVAYDLAGIEARVNAWFADDTRAIEVFLAGLDPYRVNAAQLFGVPYDRVEGHQRKVGKEMELACGYQMGGVKFGDRCASQGIDLAAAGLDAAEVVAAWRTLHAPIVQTWQACERAWIAAVAEGAVTQVGPCEFAPSDNGRDVVVFLPSGRPLVYHDARVTMATTAWGREKPSPSYLTTDRGRQHTYGGSIVENLVQAMSRDIFAEAMLRVERGGIPLVLHVHDEAVGHVRRCEERSACEYMQREFERTPEWAPGLPVRVTGYSGRRYRKA